MRKQMRIFAPQKYILFSNKTGLDYVSIVSQIPHHPLPIRSILCLQITATNTHNIPL